MTKKKINVMLTAFRDGFQSVYGARVISADFWPVVEFISQTGINHFEIGGGARFQSSYMYSNEDAFTMMEKFRKTLGPSANLQTLARGINVVGLESQSSDIIDLHAKLFKKYGVTTIRNFDALNDVNNLIFSGKCIANAKLKHEVTVSMMKLPPGCKGAHDKNFYIRVLKEIIASGVPYHSICFKDASGTSSPSTVYDVIKEAKTIIPSNISLAFHTHETAGTSVLAYQAAINAGVDTIDLSIAPVSGGTCQPDILTMHHALEGTNYTLDLDVDKILKAESLFKQCMSEYIEPREALAVEPLIHYSPMPGGALTANTEMMRDNKTLDKLNDVLIAMRETVEKGGFGTSVTPVSQFYFQQAYNNVIFGPWNKIAEGYGKMVLGYFGKTPVKPDAEVIKIAALQLNLEPTKKSPLEINDSDPSKGIIAMTKKLEANKLPVTDENIFIVATCKDKGIEFLKGNAKVLVRKKKPASDSSSGYTVNLRGKPYTVVVKDNCAIVNGKEYNFNIKKGIDGQSVPSEIKEAATESSTIIRAPLPSTVLSVKVKIGDTVSKGDTIMVLEAMKMETNIQATKSGTITSISVSVGDGVSEDHILASIN